MEELGVEVLRLVLGGGGILTVPASAPAPASPQKAHFLLLRDFRCGQYPLLAPVPQIQEKLLVGTMELPAARAAPPHDPDRQVYSLFPSSRSRSRTRYNILLFPS